MKSKFSISRGNFSNLETVIARFQIDDFPLEVFCQQIQVSQQNAYRHLLVENLILRHYGENFRRKIIDLKNAGRKTEPAFAEALNLTGDPYLALLEFKVD